ncbi:MAG: response regulator transcription factor [bacterium]
MNPNRKAIKIIIVEDNKFIRSGWEILLGSRTDFEVIGSYGSFEDASAHDKISETDLVLMDLQLPGISGVEGIRQIKSRCPEVTIVVCTAYEDNEKIFEAISAGAIGFIEKKAREDEMLFFLRNAVEGVSPMSPNIARKLLSIQKENSRVSYFLRLNNLGMEQSILEKIAEGKSYTSAASELHLDVEKVMKTISGIYQKLQNKESEKN